MFKSLPIHCHSTLFIIIFFVINEFQNQVPLKTTPRVHIEACKCHCYKSRNNTETPIFVYVCACVCFSKDSMYSFIGQTQATVSQYQNVSKSVLRAVLGEENS